MFQTQIIELLDIPQILKKFPHQISAGEAQRASLARSLITQPYLLLLDDEAVAFLSKELETFQPLRFHPSIYAAIVDQHKNNESPWQSTELNDTETPRYTKSFGVEEHRFVVAQDSSTQIRQPNGLFTC